MTLQQAKWVAIIKRILGWVIFIPALLSTIISLCQFAYKQSTTGDSMNAVISDFVKIIIEMMRANTHFLDIFWNNSPTPDKLAGMSGANIGFIVIYILMFVGLAMSASGIRMWRQVKFVKENIEDQTIVENAKESGITKQELKEKIRIPHHTIFSQIFILYILPIFIGIIAWFLIKFLGW